MTERRPGNRAKHSSGAVLLTAAAVALAGGLGTYGGVAVLHSAQKERKFLHQYNSSGGDPFPLKFQQEVVDTGGFSPTVQFKSGVSFTLHGHSLAGKGGWSIDAGSPGDNLKQTDTSNGEIFQAGNKSCTLSVNKTNDGEEATLACTKIQKTSEFIVPPSGDQADRATAFVIYKKPSTEDKPLSGITNRTPLALAA